eukprot:TRINITY_DN44568_c0_g1_i1.p1 TRINITY_DN44568_c0_g1~~TRINITY_DN44568_c0_g1_i1.p1  ORF type:complete len:1062 (-),score=146.97 TRINITY_DN44568_c0_g1_i1:190-3375(-)
MVFLFVSTAAACGFDERELGGYRLPSRIGARRYCALVPLAVLSASAVNIVMWSSLCLGDAWLAFLVYDLYAWRLLPGFACAAILVYLYLFDFFWPPHLPDTFFCLRQRGSFVGRPLLGLSGVLFLASAIMSARDLPSIPIFLTLVLLPISAVLPHYMTRSQTILADKDRFCNSADTHSKMQLLASIAATEADSANFLKASCVGFALSFVATLTAWLVWVTWFGRVHQTPFNEKELSFLTGVSPLLVAIVNLTFFGFVMLRLRMHRTYIGTDGRKAELFADCDQLLVDDDSGHYKVMLQAARDAIFDSLDGSSKESIERRRQQHIQQVSRVIKCISCIMLLLVFMLYAVSMLVNAELGMIVSTMFALSCYLLVMFNMFVCVAFRRVVREIAHCIIALLARDSIRGLLNNEWIRATMLCVVLPFLPVVLAVSAVNQFVRKRRGISDHVPEVPFARHFGLLTDSSADSPRDDDQKASVGGVLWLTPRVRVALVWFMSYDWLSVASKCYVMCAVYLIGFSIFPLLLNVVLSWTIYMLRDFHFATVCIMSFIIGFVAFLLPVVPGMTVYLFGGLIVAGKADSALINVGGFWSGALINILLSWLLKLVACAVQQKCIGEALGRRLWVRQVIGVHKVAVRCIDKILREPGLTVAKVAVLCGGPDWPTSVTAGILRLSLFECELGTLPIIFFIVPCALSGSFYLKKGESEVWSRAANLMIFLSFFINMALLAMVAWSIQKTLEKHYDFLTTPLAENVDLEWLDHKAAQIEERSGVKWIDVPVSIRSAYSFGAVVHIFVCQACRQMSSQLFGSFEVTDDISTVRLVGDPSRALFSPLALVLLGVYGIALGFYFVFQFWRWRVVHVAQAEASLVLDGQEAVWKQNWLLSLSEKQHVPGAEDVSEAASESGIVCEHLSVGILKVDTTFEVSSESGRVSPNGSTWLSAASGSILEGNEEDLELLDAEAMYLVFPSPLSRGFREHHMLGNAEKLASKFSPPEQEDDNLYCGFVERTMEEDDQCVTGRFEVESSAPMVPLCGSVWPHGIIAQCWHNAPALRRTSDSKASQAISCA